MNQFKKGRLVFSGYAEKSEEIAQKLSEKVYYNSKLSLTIFKQERGVNWYYVVNHKGDVQQSKVVRQDKNNKFQYRYL